MHAFVLYKQNYNCLFICELLFLNIEKYMWVYKNICIYYSLLYNINMQVVFSFLFLFFCVQNLNFIYAYAYICIDL